MKTPKSFRCNRCGSCCKISPFLADADIKRIIKAGYPLEFFLIELHGKRFMRLEDDKCVFLDNSKKICSCIIYKSRPITCRQYPSEIRPNGDCRPI